MCKVATDTLYQDQSAIEAPYGDLLAQPHDPHDNASCAQSLTQHSFQVGVPPRLLRAFCRPPCLGPGGGLDAVEGELWALLPAKLREAWDSSGHRISSGEEEVRLPRYTAFDPSTLLGDWIGSYT